MTKAPGVAGRMSNESCTKIDWLLSPATHRFGATDDQIRREFALIEDVEEIGDTRP